MALYDYACKKCGKSLEVLSFTNSQQPVCCGEVMTRKYSIGTLLIKEKYPSWIDRIDDLQKRSRENGGRTRFVHPKEVRAT